MTGARRHRLVIGVLICTLLAQISTNGRLLFAHQEAILDPVATREYAVALGFQKKKLFEQASVRWTQFITRFGNDTRIPNAQYHLGVCQLQSGNVEAATTFLKVLTQFPKFEQRDAVQFNLGLALYNKALTSKTPDDFKTAAVEFSNLLAHYAQSSHIPAALYYQAECMFQAGDRPGAITLYQKLIAEHAADPLLPTALFALATTQQEIGKNAEAAATYRSFLEKFPTDRKAAECRLRFGVTLTELKSFAEAEKEFATAAGVKDFTLADLALFHQARSQREQNQLPEAASIFESLPQRFKDSEYVAVAQLEGGKCRFLANQFPQAKAAFTVVMNAKKNESPEAAWWLGKTLIQLKQAPTVIPILDQAIAEWPQSEFLPDLTFTRIEAIYEDEKRRPETVTLYAQFAERFATDELAADARYRASLTALQLSDLVVAQQQSDLFVNNAAFKSHLLLPDAIFVAAESRLVAATPDLATADALYHRIVTEFPEHPQSPGSRVRIGFCLFSREQYDPAIASLNAVVPGLKTPELVAEAQFLIGLSQTSMKRRPEAVAALRAARQAKADWERGDEVLLALATALIDADQPDAAIVELNQLIQQFSKSEYGDRAWFRLGEIQNAQKKFDGAVGAFQQVVARYPVSELAPLALYGAGSTLFDKTDYAGAINQLNGLLSQFPRSAIAANGLYLRGLCQHRQKNYAAAIVDLHEFLTLNPANENVKQDAQYSLVLCHAGLKQPDQTILVANELLKLKPDYVAADKVMYELAFAYSETAKPKESADTFRQLATKIPDSDLAPECWLRVADYHSTEKQLTEAIAACKQGLTKVKDFKLKEQLQFRLGSSQFSADAFADAATTLQAQITEHPQGSLLTDSTWLVGESLFRQNKYQEAIPWYQKTIDAKPEKYHARAMYRAGTCANELRQWSLGEHHFTALTTQFPKFEQVGEALYGLGFALQNQNQLDQASVVYERVTKETNTESAAKARFMMGECAFAQKKYDIAWQHFLEAAIGYPYPEWQVLGHFEAARCFIELKMPDKARDSLQEVVEKFPNHARAHDAAKLLADLKAAK